MSDFTDLIDLAAERVGGVALLANDEFFAEKENLLRAHAAVWREHEYTDRGKWMDGWESRRRRDGGTHDWCVVRLGLPGIVRGVVVDTSFFRGNYPEQASIEGVELSSATRDLAAAVDPATPWKEILPRSPLKGDSRNLFPITTGARVTHLRLNIFPDGGVARLRVHGEVVPDWASLTRFGGAVDLAAAENGGAVLVCSDMFFGSRHNLISPGRSVNMSDGWETRRRRGPGNDWTIVRLGARGTLRRIELDTSHFKGNAPGRASLEACDADGADVSALTGSTTVWRTVVREFPVQAHTRHLLEEEVRRVGPVTHVRLNVYPDGGVARLRLYGEPVVNDAALAGVARLNALDRTSAVAVFASCCASRAWSEKMADARPFEDLAALQRVAERTWWTLTESDWREAFAAHPRIGGGGAKPAHGEQAARWSAQEQSGVSAAAASTKEALAKANDAYEQKQGFVFLVCATGKSAEEMLAMLEQRLGQTRERELRTAAEEHAMITALRLRKWVSST